MHRSGVKNRHTLTSTTPKPLRCSINWKGIYSCYLFLVFSIQALYLKCIVKMNTCIAFAFCKLLYHIFLPHPLSEILRDKTETNQLVQIISHILYGPICDTHSKLLYYFFRDVCGKCFICELRILMYKVQHFIFLKHHLFKIHWVLLSSEIILANVYSYWNQNRAYSYKSWQWYIILPYFTFIFLYESPGPFISKPCSLTII